jgi:integration host factor subunit beta
MCEVCEEQMTRAELINYLANKHPNMQVGVLDDCVKYIFSMMADALEKGQRIEIRGFGSFSLRYRQPRLARNPKTGEMVHTESKYAPHFKPGKELRERVNEYKTSMEES